MEKHKDIAQTMEEIAESGAVFFAAADASLPIGYPTRRKIYLRIIPLLALLVGTAVCGGPTQPTNQPPPTSPPAPKPVLLAVFTDPVSGFMTSDVHDIDEQTVQFDINNSKLIWVLDGQSFPGYGVSGNLINGQFQVRFGTKDGSCRAYFTEASRGTICKIDVRNGQLSISPTDVLVPRGC
jgi:hypothetical protein